MSDIGEDVLLFADAEEEAETARTFDDAFAEIEADETRLFGGKGNTAN